MCEDAPCCGCCGNDELSDWYYDADEWSAQHDYDLEDEDEGCPFHEGDSRDPLRCDCDEPTIGEDEEDE